MRIVFGFFECKRVPIHYSIKCLYPNSSSRKKYTRSSAGCLPEFKFYQMKPIYLIFFISAAGIFYSSCQKPFLDPNGKESILDIDAQNYIDSAGISGTAQQNALNTFVLQLKDSLLWDQFIAIYPMLGGTPTSVIWNLKNPKNTDAAFRLTLYGNPVCSNSGVLFPFNSDYADTHISDKILTFNNNAISYYSETQNSVNGYDMGCVDYTAPYNEMSISLSNDASVWFGYNAYGIVPTVTTGLFMFSATASDVRRYDNGVVTSSKGSAPVPGFTGLSIFLGITRGAAAGGRRECGLATVGSAMTDRQAAAFCGIVKTFQTTLGR